MVVKRDKEGFGFTLSKEMPVFVDNVSHGSSADRAGILSGDRIIKVCVCVWGVCACVCVCVCVCVGWGGEVEMHDD